MPRFRLLPDFKAIARAIARARARARANANAKVCIRAAVLIKGQPGRVKP